MESNPQGRFHGSSVFKTGAIASWLDSPKNLAEGVGFEPTRAFRPYRLATGRDWPLCQPSIFGTPTRT